jgi:hypothetical protein
MTNQQLRLGDTYLLCWRNSVPAGPTLLKKRIKQSWKEPKPIALHEVCFSNQQEKR